jgi:hypothetical protein
MRAYHRVVTAFAVLGVTVALGGCGPSEAPEAEAMSAASGAPGGAPVHDGQELWGHYLQP